MERTSAGWGSGLLGVVIFSGSLPATRIAVADFSPVFLTSARAVIAALLGASLLLVLGERRPARSDAIPLAIVALGVVIGFPLLTALALQHITAAHSIVFVGLLPLATAVFGVLRGGGRGLRAAASRRRLADRRRADDRRHPALRARLCRRSGPFAPARRLAG